MDVGYCEKDCGQCAMREELNCPGCRMGPGNEMYGTCDIAACCRKNKLESCGDCPKKVGCTVVAVKDLLASRRKIQFQLRKAKTEVMGTRAPFLKKCFWALFWLNLLPGFLPNFFPAEGRQYYALLCVDEVINLIAAVVVMAMTKEERGYQMSGPILAGLAVHDFLMYLFTTTEPPLWAVFTSLVTPYVRIAAIWLLFEIHAIAAVDQGGVLTPKWKKLRKWYCGAMLVIELCSYLTIFGPMLFSFITSFAALALAIAQIIELVYLAKMAKGYKTLSLQNS